MIPGMLCNCCGLPLSGMPVDGNCPRCGYPVDPLKEERFLRESVRDLQRVVAYGGAAMTVVGLMQRYQSRLQLLIQRRQAFEQPAQPMATPGKREQPDTPINAKTSYPAMPAEAVL